MNADPNQAKAIFLEAIEQHDPARWPAFLDEACAGQPELRRRVEALLQAHREAGTAPDQAHAEDPAGSEEDTAAARAGDVLGPYKLLEVIGEGGMGAVWMAEQREPVRRKVALKLIKAGMDSRQVVARFEQERQALALMDHPNIAKVFDAGVSPDGRSYFVMELVKGVPITRYCDAHRLTPRQRLELFVQVCCAVQHAHQKGIIHRDLKPSNVLVALYDDVPVVKVIDFGVAKAAGQPLTEATLHTGFGAVVGTLEYMSPEQASFNNLDVDTRSDIYSLGVLLYELLAGSTPFSRQELERAGMLEMLRVIREQEPSKPSTKLSTAEGLPALAADRGTEPAKLTRLVRGELDWIVMKALEKDRSRRYETANGFAMDVQRYLADEPVLAGPPSAWYRLRKFARRNKAGLAVAALVLFFLVLLGSGVGWAVRDRSAREAEAAQQQAARQGKAAGQVESIFAEVDQLEKEQKWPEALAAGRRAAAAVAGGEADAETAERVRVRLKDLEFIDRLEQIRMADRVKDPGKDREYARAFRDYGVDVDELAVEASIERLKAHPVLAIPLGAALDEWVAFRRGGSKGDDRGWKRLVAVAHGIDPEPLRDRLRAAPWPITPEARDELRRLAELIDARAHHPMTLYRLAVTLDPGPLGSARDRAIRILRDAQAVYPEDYWLNFRLGYVLSLGNPSKQDRDDAIRFWTVAVALRPSAAAMQVYHPLVRLLRQRGDPDDAIAVYRQLIQAMPRGAGSYWSEIGDIRRDQKKLAEADDAYRRAIAIHRQAIAAEPEHTVARVFNIGNILLRGQGKPAEAIAFYRQASETWPEAAGNCWHAIGDILRDQKKLAEADDADRKAVAFFRQAIAARPERIVEHAFLLGDILRAQGKPDEAVAAYREAAKACSFPPNAYMFWERLCKTLIAQGKTGEAIAAYREAIAAIPEYADFHYRSIGDILIAQGKPDEALAEYRNAFAAYVQAGEAGRKPAAHSYLTLIGRTLITHGKVDEAIAFHRQLIEAGPEHAATYLSSLGDILRAQKKPAKAVEAYGKAVELKPNDPGCRHRLGLALRDQKNLAEANAAFDRAIELYRKAPDLTPAARSSVIGSVMRDKGELDEAIVAFRKAFDSAPTHNPFIHDLLNALRARGRLAEATDVYRKAIEANPTSFYLHDDFRKFLTEQNKLDEAVTVYRKAVELAPTSNLAAAVHFEFGIVLRREKRVTEAIVAYHRAIELDQKNFGAGAYNNLGALLCDDLKVYDQAAECFRKAIELAPNSADYHCNLGNALRGQGKREDAIAAYRKAIELYQKHPRGQNARSGLAGLLNGLAWTLATDAEPARRDPARAASLAKEAVELEPLQGGHWNTLGAAQYRAGNWKDAIAALEKSMELSKGGDSSDWFFLAMAHWKLGEKDKAREWYDKAVQWMDKNQPKNDELRRFRAEAAELLELKEKK
jgi:tetratricopeptide (TPR) repeat protein